MSTLVGMLLSDRYRLDEQVGAGGMSTVYRAFDVTLERAVAIKLMHREIARDSDQLERFRREARAVAQLAYPHVVGVIDAGEDEGRPYIVFEFIDGETLKQRIRRLGRLPISEAIAYAIEIGRALEAAHAHHIVHRDVKPQNVLIDPHGSAKVTDFGIARSLDEDGLTADGRVLGTTDYVSPEQALGHEVDGASDVYSLGIVLFEMLTGDVPFHGENQVAVAMKHVREELPDVQAIRPEVSATLAAVVDHLTEKDLSRRCPDATSAIAELEDALAVEASRSGGSTGEATAVLRSLPPSTRRGLPLRVRWHVPAALVAVVLIAVAVVLAFGVRETANRTTRGTGAGRVTVPKGTQVVSVRGTSATDYDPLGDDAEHAAERNATVDRDPDTTWSTETYATGDLQKAGVGLYVDAAPSVNATQLQIDTPTTGWKAEIYVAAQNAPAEIDSAGWKRVGGGEVTHKEQRFQLDTGGQRFRYYLVWITALPKGEQRAEIGELRLLQPK